MQEPSPPAQPPHLLATTPVTAQPPPVPVQPQGWRIPNSTGAGRGGRGMGNRDAYLLPPQCFNCGQVGHLARNCGRQDPAKSDPDEWLKTQLKEVPLSSGWIILGQQGQQATGIYTIYKPARARNMPRGKIGRKCQKPELIASGSDDQDSLASELTDPSELAEPASVSPNEREEAPTHIEFMVNKLCLSYLKLKKRNVSLLFVVDIRVPPEEAKFLKHKSNGSKISQFTDVSMKEVEFEGKTSFGMSVFNLSNAIMGSGILGLSYAMSNTGIILFLILLTCIACLSCYSIHLLLRSAGVVGIRAYEQLGLRAFGHPGKILAAVIITLHNIGGYLGYTSGFSLSCMVFFLSAVIYKKFNITCSLEVFGNYSIRRALLQLLFPGKPFQWLRHITIAVCLLFAVNLLVILVPNIRDIFGITGLFYICIIPINQEPMNSRPKIQAACFTALGFIFMSMSLTFIGLDWMSGEKRNLGGH
ncbi:Sodium-coupled neutral amino acid transporter 3 N-system amino acid transporter 1 [Collichthys lucidus]|uniref:Sodium-coupled neutral amino acid transporter 3 N-system amino acid transporter 1 n=1 Tax=Collichthys lucidus TaxID=240159 RepID=A0A4U5USG6_COLLU|nr:Sodium-coupled neutral amino acid transporter 3 N-system amino acid transporter 1 [Collichthys lucidus]